MIPRASGDPAAISKIMARPHKQWFVKWADDSPLCMFLARWPINYFFQKQTGVARSSLYEQIMLCNDAL
jgi:hypothetical protein